jgi:hypothetical protein
MPCYTPPMWKDEFGNWHDGERPQSWCDKQVRMLCSVLSTLTPDQIRTLSPEVQGWWKEHQEWDRLRKANPRARR